MVEAPALSPRWHTDRFGIFQPIKLPDPNAELKNAARLRREAGETIKVIAESLNRNRKTVAEWCEGIKPPSPVESEVLGILRDGAVWKTSDIVAHSRFARRNVMSALKKLLDADKIDRIKRSFYQITNSFLIVTLLSRLTSTILIAFGDRGVTIRFTVLMGPAETGFSRVMTAFDPHHTLAR